jgi:glycosyl transferase family 25
MGQIPIFLVNLDRSPERLERMTQRLNALNLTFERVAAVDGGRLSEEQRRATYVKRYWRNAPTPGEIGCHLSHMKALKEIASRKLPLAIILEDDVELAPAFATVARENIGLPADLDVLKLEGVHLKGKSCFKIGEAGGGFTLAVIPNTYGSAAYLVTATGAKRILERLALIRYRYDDDLFSYWRNGLMIYDLFPYPAKQTEEPTTILGRRAVQSARKRLFMKFARRIPKNYDKLKKRICELYRFGFHSVPLETLGR